MEENQKINCTVVSCRFNDEQRQKCELGQIIVEPCQNCYTGDPAEESMCGSYEQKDDEEETMLDEENQ